MSDQDCGESADLNFAEHETLLDGAEAGNAFSLDCPEGHRWLPPRRICPTCGSTELRREPLPDVGRVRTYTTIEVPLPDFGVDAPYTTAIATFGSVSITAIIPDLGPEEIDIGQEVTLSTLETAEGTRLFTLKPHFSDR